MPELLKWFFIILLAIDLAFVNVGVVKLIFFPSRQPALITIITPTPTPVNPKPIEGPTAPTTPIAKPIPFKSTAYVPVPGSGTGAGNSWVDIPGTDFYLNPSDYPGLKEAYFEANFKLLNGNGTAFIRLIDTTVGIEVWGSEVTSHNQNFTTVVSSKLTLRPGNHLYQVQAKSLTADTAVYNSGRLKLVSQN